MRYPAELHPRELLAYFNRRAFIKTFVLRDGRAPTLGPCAIAAAFGSGNSCEENR